MPPMPPSDDGLFHCQQCDSSYKAPQALGRHMQREHGVAGQSAAAKYRQKQLARQRQRPKAQSVLPVRAHPQARPTNGHAPLTADALCRTVLTELLPSSYIHVDGIEPYVVWLRATEGFLEALSNLP